ncbi:hypothetical protein GJ496_006911 [Pomphorhynchus laevis]|nr:hypothetical protein GJ496_006911 [Pomphorhynchus laevis]
MPYITLDLLRKKSEHNDGSLEDLEEISLHQENLQGIDVIDRVSRNIRILLLQGNLIAKIENLSRLKRLEYINLAINNIEVIENLSDCESLKKLDLSVNFIYKVSGVQTLKENRKLTELYLSGNDCCQYKLYRSYVVATLPFLKTLDGVHISSIERQRSIENYYDIRKQIEVDEELQKSLKTKQSDEWPVERVIKLLQQKSSDVKIPYCRNFRLANYVVHRLNETKIKKEEPVKKSTRKYFKDDGTPWNCNEPGCKFKMDLKDDVIYLEVHIPKYLETNQITIDLQPSYIRIVINRKIMQLTLPEEISPDLSTSHRSTTSGHLLITMPKVSKSCNSRNSSAIIDINTEKISEMRKISNRISKEECSEHLQDQIVDLFDLPELI